MLRADPVVLALHHATQPGEERFRPVRVLAVIGADEGVVHALHLAPGAVQHVPVARLVGGEGRHAVHMGARQRHALDLAQRGEGQRPPQALAEVPPDAAGDGSVARKAMGFERGWSAALGQLAAAARALPTGAA